MRHLTETLHLIPTPLRFLCGESGPGWSCSKPFGAVDCFTVHIHTGSMFLASILLSASLSLSYSEEPGTTILWHWGDDFNTEEQNMVREWLTRVSLPG